MSGPVESSPEIRQKLAGEPLGDAALLRLLQLTSPALPIGAFAYSQGLECAASVGWVKDAESLADWLTGLLMQSLPRVDVPILARSYDAWSAGDSVRIRHLARLLHALRETRELVLEERQLGRSLGRCLAALGIERAAPFAQDEYASVSVLFALAAVQWEIPLRTCALGYLTAWAQNQISAGLRLLPMGQIAGQEVLSALLAAIPAAADSGLRVADDAIGFTAPAQAIASALHETQYSRLFRS